MTRLIACLEILSITQSQFKRIYCMNRQDICYTYVCTFIHISIYVFANRLLVPPKQKYPLVPFHYTMLHTSLAIWSNAWSSAFTRELTRRRPTALELSIIGDDNGGDVEEIHCKCFGYIFCLLGTGDST